MQVTRASSDPSIKFSVSGPWTEYVKMLPEYISLPTAWHDDQINLLNGTSLEVRLSKLIIMALSINVTGRCLRSRLLESCYGKSFSISTGI